MPSEEAKTDLNGIRIPLLVDTAMLVLGLIYATLMYGDVQALKDRQVPEARVVAVEVELRNLSYAVQTLQAQQDESTQRIIDAILRENKTRVRERE